MNKDLFGIALLDYHNGKYTEDIITWTSISDEDILPLPYLFRDFNEMPKLEQEALKLASGKILDVGCGAGSHSLWLQQKGLNVKGIDISEGAVEVAINRGVKNVELKSLLKESETFDTILLLMNGTGIFKELSQVFNHLNHLISLLNTGGKILVDSSDISYMYHDDNGGKWIELNKNYYGELDYFIRYKDEEELPMKWLYLDYDTLNNASNMVGLKFTKIMDCDHFDYLAQLEL